MNYQDFMEYFYKTSSNIHFPDLNIEKNFMDLSWKSNMTNRMKVPKTIEKEKRYTITKTVEI